jgi:hypothetical protein
MVLEGCSTAMRARAAIGLKAGGSVAALCGVLELKAGCLGDEEDEPMRQAEELGSKLEVIILPATAEQQRAWSM